MKTYALHDFRLLASKGPGFGGTAFVDLDETLINAIGRQKRRRHEVLLDCGDRFWVIPRPIAGLMLSTLRTRFSRVVMFTMASRDYALKMNSVFGFGFGEGDVLAFEDFAVEVNEIIVPKALTTHPGSILIDNEHPAERNAIVKRAFLGPSLYVELRAFNGRPDPADFGAHLEEMLQQIAPQDAALSHAI